MNISKEYPPNIKKIRDAFPIDVNTVFTYGDTLYAPLVTFRIPPDLIEHETVHKIQQGDDPELWWDRYIFDPEYRYVQELQAYRSQYKFYCGKVKDRNARTRFLVRLAHDFSSPLYGNIVKFFDAVALIKN